MSFQNLKLSKGIAVGFIQKLARSRIITQNIPLISFFSSSLAVTKISNFMLPEILSQASWTIFLQSSLILALWSNFDRLKISNFSSDTSYIKSNVANAAKSSYKMQIVTMAIAFLLGSIGSCLGAYFGYMLSVIFLKFRYQTFNNIPFDLIIQLKMIASCITASYIGGTANFFETNQVLMNSIFSYNKKNILQHLTISSSSMKLKTELTTALNAVAGIDIIVMIAYFSVLTSIQRYAKLKANRTVPNILDYNTDYSIMNWQSKHKKLNDEMRQKLELSSSFSNQPSRYHFIGYKENYNTEYSLSRWREKNEYNNISNNNNKDSDPFFSTTSSSSLLLRLYKIVDQASEVYYKSWYIFKPFLLKYITPLVLAVSICLLSHHIQVYIPFPGVSVMSSLIMGLVVAEFIVYRVAVKQTTSTIDNEAIRSKVITLITKNIKNSCSFLSELMLITFYILIGLTSKLSDILKAGWPALILISTSLLTHLLFIFTATTLWNSITYRYFNWKEYKKSMKVSDVSRRTLASTDLGNAAGTTNTGMRGVYSTGTMTALSKKRNPLRIDVDTSVIASNACIGGSSTAASMAGSINRADLIFPATLVGIIGYVIGTPLGLMVAKMLRLEKSMAILFLLVGQQGIGSGDSNSFPVL